MLRRTWTAAHNNSAVRLWGNESPIPDAILRARYEPNDDHRTDANDELTLVALPMIVC